MTEGNLAEKEGSDSGYESDVASSLSRSELDGNRWNNIVVKEEESGSESDNEPTFFRQYFDYGVLDDSSTSS